MKYEPEEAVAMFSYKFPKKKKAFKCFDCHRCKSARAPIKTVLSDHDSQFTCAIWATIISKAGIKHTFSSIRHPASNTSERALKELGRIFRSYCNESNSSWAHHLQNIETLFNTLPHVSTGYSLHEILYNTTPIVPFDHLIQKYLPKPSSTQRTVEELHAQVYANLVKNAQLRHKTSKRPVQLEIGDWVLFRVPSISDASAKIYSKFHFLYKGPFIILAKPYPNVYTLGNISTPDIKGNYNLNNIKFYHRKLD